MLKRLARGILNSFGYAAIDTRHAYSTDGLYTRHRDRFRNDPRFRAAYARGVKAGAGYDPKFEWRVHVALWAAERALRARGDFVECGVNAGVVSSAIMQYLDWRRVDRRFWLIDTFAGPVFSQYSEAEVAAQRVEIARTSLAGGNYVTDLARVRDNFAEWPNAVIVQGEVPGILPSIGHEPVAFLHIDMNCAYPEAAALEYFWPRLLPGAVVLFDDYTYFGHEHQSEAIDGVLKRIGAEILSLPTGQGLIVK